MRVNSVASVASAAGAAMLLGAVAGPVTAAAEPIAMAPMINSNASGAQPLKGLPGSKLGTPIGPKQAAVCGPWWRSATSVPRPQVSAPISAPGLANTCWKTRADSRLLPPPPPSLQRRWSIRTSPWSNPRIISDSAAGRSPLQPADHCTSAPSVLLACWSA